MSNRFGGGTGAGRRSSTLFDWTAYKNTGEKLSFRKLAIHEKDSLTAVLKASWICALISSATIYAFGSILGATFDADLAIQQTNN